MKNILNKLRNFLDFKDAKRQFDLLIYPDKKTTMNTLIWVVAMMTTLLCLVTFVIDPASIYIVKTIATGTL
ncbi:hypothetical protein [Photobacterium damselae]|uniref:hypothetical protein n=1 Tax=Photobacterium damselae TaxID=38293 RepID=UPI0040684033